MKHEVIYMTAEQLGLTDAEYEGLLRIKGELERGELRHVPEDEEDDFPKDGFNMNLEAPTSCGTVVCIGGWLKVRGQLRGTVSAPDAERLQALFWPCEVEGRSWSDITPAQAAGAIGNFLATGEPRWAECVA